MRDVKVFSMQGARELGESGVVEWTPGKWWAVQVTHTDGSFTPLHMGSSKDDAMRWLSRRDMLHSIFVTALEGGIGYWSRCITYRWSIGSKSLVEDLLNFEAVIVEMVDDENEPKHTINAEVIERGLTALAQGKATVGDLPMEQSDIALYAGINATDDADIRIDSSIADNIVQAGLFNDVRYG